MWNMLRTNGGGGYARLPLDLGLALERAVITDEHLDTMFVDSPRRWLSGA
jgi:hypothetical protein